MRYSLLSLLIFSTAVALINCDPLIELPLLGKLKGTIDRSLNGLLFNKFESIPYAQPPIGELRFKEPQSIKSWQPDTLKVNTHYKCLQYNHFTPPGADYIVGEEDCLYLNVYTPTLDQNARLDVIVYIHGGAFMFHNPTVYQPHYLIDKNVVVVSFNYRLGPLGFLSTENETLPGNNGFRDQIMALEFIKKHIKYFGGNPDSITITGLSAGGASVHLHMLSRKSRGLFNRAISQSGCALNPWVLMEKPLEKTQKLADLVGCNLNKLQDLVECLRRRPGRQIVQAVKEFQPFLYNPFSPFGIVVDGDWSSKDPIFTQHPFKLILNGDVAPVPWLVSHTSAEGLYPGSDFYDDVFLEEIDARWDELMPFIIDYNHTINPKLHKFIAKQVRDYYLKDDRVNKATYLKLIELIGDRMFVDGLIKSARYQSSTVKAPVYYYYFTYRGQHSHSEDKRGTELDFGACHGDDTSYIFKTNLDTTSDQNDRKMVDLLVEMVTSFAKDGKPKVPKVEWLTVSKNRQDPLRYLKISSPNQLEMLVDNDDSLGNRKFWSTLPFNENEPLFPQKDEL